MLHLQYWLILVATTRLLQLFPKLQYLMVNEGWNNFAHKMNDLYRSSTASIQMGCSHCFNCFNIYFNYKYSFPLEIFMLISIPTNIKSVEYNNGAFMKYNSENSYKFRKDENIINSIKLNTTTLINCETDYNFPSEIIQPTTETIECRARYRYSQRMQLNLNLNDYEYIYNEYTLARNEYRYSKYLMNDIEGNEARYCRQRSRCRDMRFRSYNRCNYVTYDAVQEPRFDSDETEEGEMDLIQEDDHDPKSIFVPNDNMEDSIRYNEDIDDVDHKIKEDMNQMYSNLSKHFDDCFPSDDSDLILNVPQPQKQIKNDNEDLVEHEDTRIEPDELVTDHDNDNDNEQEAEEEEYIPQVEGHKEVIGGKTYLNPRNTKNIGPVFAFGKQWNETIKPKYQHFKEEVLNNKYATITERTWNAILVKCHRILKGEFASKKRNRWSKLLKKNKIGMKHLVALKLYTDFDLLQREFRKSFRLPYNENKERLQAFYHWRQALKETFERFSRIPTVMVPPARLYHGINSIMCLDEYKGVYYGPCSTTTDLQVARAFAGKNGMILVMKPEKELRNPVLDISWISDYPDEREYLLFDHRIEIETWILTSDFDEFYHYYWNILTNNKTNMKEPSGHLSYEKQQKAPKYLNQLKQLVDEVEIKDNKSTDITFKQNVEFKKNVKFDKIDLLMWLFRFALGYKYGNKKPTKYDQTLNANLQHAMKQVHVMKVPSKLVQKFMCKLSQKFQGEEFSAYFISEVLNEYFRNTYCKLLI